MSEEEKEESLEEQLELALRFISRGFNMLYDLGYVAPDKIEFVKREDDE